MTDQANPVTAGHQPIVLAMHMAKDQKNQTAEITIEGEIGSIEFDGNEFKSNTSAAIRAQLQDLIASDVKHITVNIHSLGGYVDDAMAIHDALQMHPAQVTTRVTGFTASAATIIAQAASPGKREISDNSMYLVHEAWGAVVGTAADLQKHERELNKVNERMARIYSKRGGRSEQFYRAIMAENTGAGRWLSATEAKELGFADNVFEPMGMAAMAVSAEKAKALGLPVPSDIATTTTEQNENQTTNQKMSTENTQARGADTSDYMADPELVKAHQSRSGSVAFGPQLGGLSGISGPFGSDEGIERWKALGTQDDIPVLSKGQKMAHVINGSRAEMERYPDWHAYLLSRIQNSGSGGFLVGGSGPQLTSNLPSLVPSHLSAEIIDMARSKAQVFAAGAKSFPMEHKEVTLARITQDPTVEWKPEGDDWNASTFGAEPVTFTAKTMITGVSISVELGEDSPNAVDVIRNTISNALAQALDRSALFGTGQNEQPRGLYNYTSGVQVLSLGDDGEPLANYRPFSLAYQSILQANESPTAVIYSPRTFGDLDRLVDLQGNPLQPPRSFDKYLHLPTTQVPDDLLVGTSDDCSAIFMGDFSQMMVGMRTNLNLEMTRVSETAWRKLAVEFRAYMRYDIQLARPGGFVVIKGVRPSVEAAEPV
jgi:HK97 family phage major capsid protein/ATP-dependent Clp endopeptidase proteolytic subunit ClpP